MQIQLEDIINEYSTRMASLTNDLIMKEASIKARDREIQSLREQIEESSRTEEPAKVKGNSKK